MSQDWRFYTDDNEISTNITALLPSSLKEVWENDSGSYSNTNGEQFPRSPSPDPHERFPEFGNNTRSRANFIMPGSAPLSGFIDDQMDDGFQNQGFQACKYFNVQFHPKRSEAFRASNDSSFKVGQHVVTEADRGYDVGVIIGEIDLNTARALKSAKKILKPATQSEIDQLPIKVERERSAMEFCQNKAKELDLPMSITGAEFQFDGKKLTFYYTAQSYVDFRCLVKVLFRTFGMRIWMVWHDGTSPIRDVLQRNEKH